MSKKRRKKQPIVRHPFKIRMPNGKERKLWFRVRAGEGRPELSVKDTHVLESMRREGIGDTQNCTMAVCTQRSPEQFNHPVEGTVDWYPSRAYVVSEVFDKRRKVRNTTLWVDGECYAYIHRDNIWKYNDTLRGQQRLLRLIQENGPYQVKLFPWRKQDNSKSPKPGGKTRDRSRVNSRRASPGAAKRLAFARGEGAFQIAKAQVA